LEVVRRGGPAGYGDRILRARSQPIYQAPTLKTAKALGIQVPPTLLALADEVIE
jgi:hypothetical protein